MVVTHRVEPTFDTCEQGGGDAQWRSLTISDIPVRTVRRAPRTSGGNPQDLAAEQSVLGGMLLSRTPSPTSSSGCGRAISTGRRTRTSTTPSSTSTVAGSRPTRSPSARSWTAAACCAASVACPISTLISTVPTAANAGYYAGIVAEKALLRRLVEAGTRVVQYGYAGAEGADVDEIVDRAQAEIYDVTERRTSEDFVPLEQLLQPTMDEIDAIASQGGLSKGVPTGFTELDELTQGLHPRADGRRRGEARYGQGLALDTPLPTPTGWTTMGEVAVGDHLIGADGNPTRVVAATEVMLQRPCYEVEFSDSSVIVADAEHQWLTETRASRKSAQAAATGLQQDQEPAHFRRGPHDARDRRDAALPHPGSATESLGIQRRAVAGRRPRSTCAAIYPRRVAWGRDQCFCADHGWDPEIVMCISRGIEAHRSEAAEYRYQLRLPAQTRSVPIASYAESPLFPRRASQDVRTLLWRQSTILSSRFRHRRSRCGGPSCGLRLCQSCRNEVALPGAVANHRCAQRQAHLSITCAPPRSSGERCLPVCWIRMGLSRTAAQFSSRSPASGWLMTFSNLSPAWGTGATGDQRVSAGGPKKSSTAYILNFSTDDDVFQLPRKALAHKEPGLQRCKVFLQIHHRCTADPERSRPLRRVDNADHLYLVNAMIPTHNSTLGLDFPALVLN